MEENSPHINFSLVGFMIFGEPLWLLNTDHQEVDFAAQASFDSFLEQQLGVGPGGIPVLAQELKEREESSESAVTSACGYVFHQNDFVYHCKTCEVRLREYYRGIFCVNDSVPFLSLSFCLSLSVGGSDVLHLQSLL